MKYFNSTATLIAYIMQYYLVVSFCYNQGLTI